MKNRLAALCVLTLLLSTPLALPAEAQDQDRVVRKKPGRTTYASATLEATEAKDHVGEEATVCGKVVSTRYLASASGTPTFLNFEKPYPDHVFTVVIWGRNRSEFGEPEKEYKDKDICVTGTIESYRGKPQIEAKAGKDIVLKGSKIKQN